MSIRIQLLSIALTTLVLPWAGCRYAREFEATLRVSQESSLQAAAATMANALSAQPERVFSDANDVQPFDSAQGDFYVFPLSNQPLLDGYRDDWNIAAEPAALPAAKLGARLQAGFSDRYLFLFLEVDDPRFDPEPNDMTGSSARFDRVDLILQRADGAPEHYFFATSAPGLIEAQVIVDGEDGKQRVSTEPRIQAFWLQTTRNYHLEARIPRTLVGSRLWVEATDGSSGEKAGFMGADVGRGGRMFFATPGLNGLLATFISPGTRATVIDQNALKLGTAGTLTPNTVNAKRVSGGAWMRRFVATDMSHWPPQVVGADRLQGSIVTRALAGDASSQWLRTINQEPLLSAAAPIIIDARTRGAVVLEQAGDQLLDLRDRSLVRLVDSTLLASALAMAIAVGIATWISLRIGRLRAAADSAVGSDGTIRLEMPESGRGDEIGALSRGFERLLGRLDEHTRYLRTLGGKLSHEMRTPLTIVRSSLDNLESEGVRADQHGYLTRAREGALRLQSILTALGAAARVEESIKQADRVNFDLNILLQSAVAGYRDGFRGSRFELEVPSDTCFMRGAPDLIVQMLDKLIENAVDFCPPTGLIRVRLQRMGGRYELRIANDGPTIPAAKIERLFESLFEDRRGQDDKPHFGLGLYIVRLIAEFHGGSATALNDPNGTGVVFAVSLPLI